MPSINVTAKLFLRTVKIQEEIFKQQYVRDDRYDWGEMTLQQWLQWNTSHSHFLLFFSGFCTSLFNIFPDPNPALLPLPPPPALSPSVRLQHTELLTPVNCLPPTPQSPLPSWSMSMEIPSQVVRQHWHNHGNSCQWGWEKRLSNLQKTGRDRGDCVFWWRKKGMKKNESRLFTAARPHTSLRLKYPLCSWLTLAQLSPQPQTCHWALWKTGSFRYAFESNWTVLNKNCYVGLAHRKDPNIMVGFEDHQLKVESFSRSDLSATILKTPNIDFFQLL